MAECRNCRAKVRWAKRPGHKPYQPGAFVMLEEHPSPDGSYALVNDRVVLWDRATPKDAPRYHAHQAFCESAGRSRSRGA